MQVKFPVTAQKFPVPQNIFPVNLRRELSEKSLQDSGFWLWYPASEPQNCNFPCKIPCYQGIDLETGAISTASPARQSGAWRLYPQ